MLNVVLAADDNYAPFLGVTIKSLLCNNEKDFKKINIYVLDDKISETNKNKIKKITTNYNCFIDFIPTKNLNDLNIHITGLERNLNLTSFTTYARLFISTLLPKDIDKIIYLDCDALVVGSFKELWNKDISNYPCAAVLDGFNTEVIKILGFEKNYINAGLLYINLAKWREDNVEKQFIEFMVANQNRFYQHDQGIINNVFKDNILFIDPKYNLQNNYIILDYDLAKKFLCNKEEYYSREIVKEAAKKPVFLHFCGVEYDRPWFNKTHPYYNTYKSYVKETPFEKDIYKNDYTLPLKGKLFYKAINNKYLTILLKMIPKSLILNTIGKNGVNGIKKEEEKAKNI